MTPTSRRVLIAGGVVVALLAAGLAAYVSSDIRAKEGRKAAKGPGPVSVTVAEAAQETVPIRVQAIGNVEPYLTVAVKARVDGQIVAVNFREGEELHKGDVLFRIDPKPYEYVVEQKRAALAEAEQNVRQLKASLDQATAAAERTNAQLELAQQNYDRQAELFEKKIIAQATLDTFTRNLFDRLRTF